MNPSQPNQPDPYTNDATAPQPNQYTEPAQAETPYAQQQPQQIIVRPTNAPQTIDAGHVKCANKLKLIWGLVCLIAPTALLIITITFYAFTNYITNSQSSSDSTTAIQTPVEDTDDDTSTDAVSSDDMNNNDVPDDVEGNSSPTARISNILMWLVGIISTITWLPGIVVGIILLATRKPVPTQVQ